MLRIALVTFLHGLSVDATSIQSPTPNCDEAGCDEFSEGACAVKLGEPVGDLHLLQAKATKITGEDTSEHEFKVRKMVTMAASMNAPRYSQVEARGTPITQGSWQGLNRTYKFSNLCYNLSPKNQERSFTYFSEDGANNSGMESLLSTAGFNECVGQYLDCPNPIECVSNRQCIQKVQISRSPIPMQAKFLNYTALVVQPSNIGNFGHLLADNLLSIVYMQRLFEVDDMTNSLWIFRDTCESLDVVGLFEPDEAERICSHLAKDIFPVFTRHPVLELSAEDLIWAWSNFTTASETAAALYESQDNFVCFDSLIVGPGQNNYLWSMHPRATGGERLPIQSYWFRQLRDAGIRMALGSMNFPLNRILVMQKSDVHPEGTGAGIGNAPDLVQHLASSFPKFNVETEDLAKLTFKQQLEKIVTTQVLFGHSGGGSFIAMFLQPGATFAALVRLEIESAWFRELGWIRYYPLLDQAAPKINQTDKSRFIPFNVSTTVAEEIVQRALDQ